MTLTTHAFVGAALGTLTANPIGGFVLGFASHFVIDSIPHGHYPLISFLRSDDPQRPYSRRAFFAITCDLLLAFALPTLFFGPSLLSPTLLLAIIGAMLPDLIVGFDIYFPSRLSRAFVYVHERAHFFFFSQDAWRFPTPLILATEFGVIFLSLTPLL